MRPEFEEAIDRLRELRTEMKNRCKALFAEGSRIVFEEHPILESFGWRQYTPYFNDGDPCVFRACIDYPVINSFDYELEYSLPKDDPHRAEYLAAEKAVIEFLQVFEKDDYLFLFGDHVSVEVSKNGAIVSEYEDHD